MLVFCNDHQSVSANESFSPSAGKPKLFVDRIRDRYPVEIVSDWKPLERSDFYLAHDRAHVDAILDCRKPNGFGNTLREVADSLYWTGGSFHNACLRAIADRTTTMSPTSGFHHATYNGSGGFCTFNGLMVAAIKLFREKRAGLIGIVDFDVHYGNGTDDIIDRLQIDYVRHIGTHQIPQNDGNIDRPALMRLLEGLDGCDLLMYQAGADAHIDDPLGGLFTTEELIVRDRAVFEFARARGIPLTWNLAGGYQKPIGRVLEIHENTLKACLEISFAG